MAQVEDHSVSYQSLVPLCSPGTPVKLAVICSLLQSEGIPYFVFNDFFGSLKVGPVIPLYNEKFILVPRYSLEKARDLIAEPAGPHDGTLEERGFTFFEKLRMALEVIFFNWIMPSAGRYNRKNDA
jgi:hypothetical protein